MILYRPHSVPYYYKPFFQVCILLELLGDGTIVAVTDGYIY